MLGKCSMDEVKFILSTLEDCEQKKIKHISPQILNFGYFPIYTVSPP